MITNTTSDKNWIRDYHNHKYNSYNFVLLTRICLSVMLFNMALQFWHSR